MARLDVKVIRIEPKAMLLQCEDSSGIWVPRSILGWEEDERRIFRGHRSKVNVPDWFLRGAERVNIRRDR